MIEKNSQTHLLSSVKRIFIYIYISVAASIISVVPSNDMNFNR